MTTASAVGEVLPLAIAVAISPIPIIAAILMLLTPRANVTAPAFLLGWVVGILLAVGIVTLLAGIIPESDPDASRPVVGVVKIVLGALLLVMAFRQWRNRPKGGSSPAPPRWMQAIDSVTAVRAAGLGFLLAAVNPKNLMMAIAAGVVIGTSDLDVGAEVLTLAVFVVLAAISVAAPVLVAIAAGDRLDQVLTATRTWLTENNATIMTVLLLVIGVVLVGKGIGSF